MFTCPGCLWLLFRKFLWFLKKETANSAMKLFPLLSERGKEILLSDNFQALKYHSRKVA